MKVLIVYGTGHGQTRKIAEFLAERFRERSRHVELYDASGKGRDPEPADFDATIVASSVRMGAYQPPVVKFVQRHLDALKAGRSAFLSVSMAAVNKGASDAADAELQKCVERFSQKSGWTPATVVHVAGALPYTQYDFVTRWIMRRIARSQGNATDTTRDHEYTDWAALERFADAFAAGGPRLVKAA